MRLLLETMFAALLLSGPALAVSEHRYSANISVQQPAAFVQLPLPASAYARLLQPGLVDLRIVDANGANVPFAVLPWREAQTEAVEQQRAVALYTLPRRPAAGTAWPMPVEVLVQGDRISVRQRGGNAAPPPAVPPGWLFDLGPQQRNEPAATALRLAWSGPAEFSAAYLLESSDDLRSWRAAGRGQVLALASPAGPLTQALVPLPADAGRFLRLVWSDPAAAPALSGAMRVAAQERSTAVDSTTAWSVAASAASTPKALHFDLGAVLPLVQIDLQGGPGTRVTPLRVEGRQRSDEAWRPVTQGVVYQIDAAGSSSRSPPLPLRAELRYLRVLPDERAAPLDLGTQLLVQARLASLVFASQGQPPFKLLAGAADARPGALPATTLVPLLEDERPRFGRATLGDWQEVAVVASQVAAEQRQAALRPWLLWTVLLAGVAALGSMVWRLARPGS